MSENQELKQLRTALKALPKGPARRIPAGLRRQIARYTRRRLAEGAPRGAIASEIGVGAPTLVRVLREEEAPGFVPVRVTKAVPSTPPLTVRGPAGVTIEGLDIEGLVALLRGLS